MIPVTPKNRKIMEVLGMKYHDVVECTKNLLSCVTHNKDLSNEDIKEIHSFIINTIGKFSNYVHATNDYVYTIHSISELRAEGIIDQSEFERQLSSVDQNRRDKHNAAIDACNQLNRQCDFYNIPRICNIDTNNRAEVADFSAHFAMATHGYALTHNYTMDEVIQKMQKDSRLIDNSLNVFKDSYDER